MSITNVPPFIKRELDQLNEILAPLLKKATKYGFWSLPLLLISVFNLFSILFFLPDKQNSVPVVILYSILGAFGMALSKEAKYKRKEIQEISAEYIIGRIKKSDIASAGLKREYIDLVKQHPVFAINYFVKFLEAENRQNRTIGV